MFEDIKVGTSSANGIEYIWLGGVVSNTTVTGSQHVSSGGSAVNIKLATGWLTHKLDRLQGLTGSVAVLANGKARADQITDSTHTVLQT